MLIPISRYVVDAADTENLSVSRSELHDLLSNASLIGIPLLVLGNKIGIALYSSEHSKNSTKGISFSSI